MGLNSRSLLVLTVLLAVSAPVATLLLWSRVRGHASLRVAQRLALVGLCQLTAVAVLAVAVNDSFYFFTSWSDLFGTPPPLTASAPHAPSRSAAAEARVVQAAFRRRDASTHGVVLDQVITGASTGISAHTTVFLPPEYNEEKYAHTRFPVVIVMPGYPGTPKIYLTRVPLPATMRTEVAAGRATPFIAVIIKESVATPRDTECADVMGGPKVETFLSREVPNDLMRLLRVRRDRSGWALLGNSTGGFCAIKLAMRHPDRFASAVSMSGYFTAILDSTTGDLYGHSRRVRDLNNPLWRLGHLPAPPIAALVSVSRNEPLWPGTRRFLAAVKLPMQVDAIIAPTGGHNTRQWAAVLPKAVDWLGLRFGPLTGPATPRAKNLVKAR